MRKTLALTLLLFCSRLASADQIVNVGPGLSFTPATVTVSPGERVTWVWMGSPHSSTSDTTTGPEVWDSSILSTGTFFHTFTTPGSYPYYCKLHSSPGGTAMNGIVLVVAPTPTLTPSPTVTPTPGLTPTATAGAPGTPSPTPGSGTAVPILGAVAMIALAIGLVGVALSLLLFSRTR